ncbi:MAG TPA: hypothetical protein VHS96_07700 [Bacteroidia bacterium]|nr:hypothetical protein [Bacteroidia bacterium]
MNQIGLAMTVSLHSLLPGLEFVPQIGFPGFGGVQDSDFLR